MCDKHREKRGLAELVRSLLEIEAGEDAMICHDGGFHYAGDFMSLEPDLIEPAALISPDERRRLLDHGYIEIVPDGVRVTDAGRKFAFAEDGGA